MVEERHAHLERVRHRRAVEVVEHVVGEPELPVEEERGRQRRVRAGRRAGTRSRAAPRCRRARRAGRGRASAHVAGAERRSSRAAARRRPGAASVATGRRSRSGPWAAARERSAPERRRHALPRVRDGRGAVLAVTAEQLVGALARERDGHVLGRELGEGDEAERREVGERLVEVPDEAVERDRLLGERELELVVLGAEDVGDEARVRRARCSRRPPRSRPRTSSPAGPSASPSARRSGSSRGRRSSIAPSGTSLISRSRTDSSRLGEQALAPLLDAAAALERRLRVAPVPSLLDLAVLDDEDAAGLELLHGGERRRGRREEPEREERVDRLVVELGRRRARSRAGSSARRRRRAGRPQTA